MIDFSRQPSIRRLLGALIIALVGCILVLDWVPPTSRDALTHHLAIPKLYLKHGGIYEIPSLAFSYYPMNLDLVYTLPLYFGNDILPKYIHFAFALLTAGLIFAYIKRHMGQVFALVGVIFFLSLPVIVRLSTTVYVDLGLIFFSTLALLYFLKWIKKEFNAKYLIISAVGCGLALGTKYNALIALFLLAAFVPFVYSKKMRSTVNPVNAAQRFFRLRLSLKAIGYGILYLLVALIIFSPWAIRNYIWTKNPVYPLFDHHLEKPGINQTSETGLEASGIISEAARGPRSLFLPFATRKMIYGESWWQTLLIPLRIFFQGRDDNPKYFDGKLNPYLLLLPLLAFFRFRNGDTTIQTEKNILLAFAVLFIIFSFFKADMRIRYIAPAIPALVILSVFGLRNMLDGIEGRFSGRSLAFCKGFIGWAVSILLCLNAVYMWQLYQRIDPLSYISGKLNRHQYIERFRPEYAAIQFANKTLPPGSRILGLFLGNRSYYIDVDLIFGDSFFRNTLMHQGSAREIADILRQKEITHILVYYRVLKRWAGQQFDYQEKARLVDFFNNHTHLIFAKGEYGLYQL